MKKPLFFRIYVLILLLSGPLAFSQVNNGATYNMEVHFLQHWGYIDSDGCCDIPDQSVIATARNNTDYLQKQLFDKSSGAANNPKVCYSYSTWDNGWAGLVDYNMGTILNSSTGVFDYEVFSWEDDGGDRCTWDDGDDNRAYSWNWVSATGQAQSSWTDYPQQYNSNNNTYYKIKYTWRFANGVKSSPLNFGTISTGTFTHNNTNRGVPTNANAALGYSNEWTSATHSNFKDGKDVSYKFTITGSKRITFSTDYAETNFDTFLQLVKLNNDGSFNSYIDGNDDSGSGNTSILTRDLCPGVYGVIIDGYSAASEGNFKLGLQVSDILVTAGSIAISPSNTPSLNLCPNATIPPINSITTSTSTLGSITYIWKRATYNNGAWSAYSDYAAAGSGEMASSLGTIGTNQRVAFYREARDCGSASATAPVTFVAHTVSASGGTIAGSMMIPSPRELPFGTLTSSIDGSGSPGITLSWEKNDGGGWIDAVGNAQTYTLPEVTTTTNFRRKTTSTCNNVSQYSNETTITVVNPNGRIEGRVVSKAGSGVNGVTITAVRTSTPPSGGIANKSYTTTTGIDGYYAFPVGLYYGNQTQGSGAAATFRVTPSKGIHVFEQEYLDKPVTQLAPLTQNVNFIDKTTFSVLGKVTQECPTCNSGTEINPIICNSANIEFLIDNIYLGNKTLTDGTYALSLDEQRNYTIKPRYKNHIFSPAQLVVPVGESPSISNQNFKDISTHTISGTILAGCSEFIGQTTLRFTQILPPNNGNPVTGCLIKDITTNTITGYYSITLPAGKYRASVISFTPQETGVNLTNLIVKDFLNDNVLNQDSLIRDIDETDKLLTLVYPRAPVLEVIGLNTVCTPTTNICLTNSTITQPYSLMAQNDSTAFTIKVWQGPAKTCPAKDSLVYLSTNIQLDDTNQDFSYNNPTGVIVKKLKGRIPNIVCPYFKTFNLRYTDKFKRDATAINKNVVVTGLKADIGTFTTISPEIPLKVLHDPPGDLSYSFWQANVSSEEAIRFYRTSSDDENGWAEVKLGTKFTAGIGIGIESSVWGSIKGSIGVIGRNASSNESIVSISATRTYSTAGNGDVVGAQGDVYIGNAFNLLYSKIHILSYTAPCTLNLKDDFIIAPNGFATEYVYSENHIVNTILPTLRDFRDNPSNTVPQKAKYSNQVSVWEQVLSNNSTNKKRAPFEKNLSIDGAVGPYTESTTTTATKTSTVEFGLEVNSQLAAELGLEIGGSGISGGVIVNTKLETGESKTNTVINSTTTGYVLDDGQSGDYFSIDIKKDPVYDTPVFELVAGTSSCPWEAGTQPRDEMQLVCAIPTKTVVDPAGEAEFILLLSNTSQSGEARTYSLSFDQSSNPNGAVVTIGGSPVVGSTNYTIGYLGSVQVLVKVKKGASNVYAYTGLKFILSDACDGGISKSVTLNTYFNSPCSNITLFAPNNEFSIKTNTVPIIMKDYTVANLSTVSLEYSKIGTSNWEVGFTRTAAQLSNDPSGTQVNWDISTIRDGQYSFRLKLMCAANVIYTPTISGVIDRTPPIMFGNPEPSDDNFVIGDQISATYNEKLGCANLNNTNVIVKNLKTNAIIPVQLGCFENKIMIIPLSSMGVLNDSMRATLQNIQDVVGNIKTTPDSWKFILGNSVAATGNNALSISPSAVVAGFQTEGFTPAALNTSISMMENATGTLDFYFNLPVAAPNDYLINYSVSGSANPSNDYTVSFFPNNFSNGKKINSNQFNGTFGTITILAGQKTAKLQIDPTGDTNAESDENIIITVNEGGDYGIAASYTMTAVILNDDGDDCLNGGNVYVLANNNVGNTALMAGTYHKSLLETTGTVESPTSVTMKGAKSVLMKPGFQVKAGSIFKANIEGCPPAPAAYSIALEEIPNQFASNNSFISYNGASSRSVLQTKSAINYEPNVSTVVNEKNIYFEFKLEEDDNVTLNLLNTFAGEKVRIIDNTNYKSGVYTAEIETATLEKGDYYLQMITKGKKTYQKVTVL